MSNMVVLSQIIQTKLEKDLLQSQTSRPSHHDSMEGVMLKVK